MIWRRKNVEQIDTIDDAALRDVALQAIDGVNDDKAGNRNAGDGDRAVDLGERPPETEPMARAAYDLATTMLGNDEAARRAAEAAYNQAVVNFTLNYLSKINELVHEMQRDALDRMLREAPRKPED